VGHRQVEHDEIGLGVADDLEALVPVRGFADDLEGPSSSSTVRLRARISSLSSTSTAR